MDEPIESQHNVTVCENLRALANAYRDDGKYTIAGALYRRALLLVDRVPNCEDRFFYLRQIMEDQASLLRRMKCGHPAW